MFYYIFLLKPIQSTLLLMSCLPILHFEGRTPFLNINHANPADTQPPRWLFGALQALLSGAAADEQAPSWGEFPAKFQSLTSELQTD